jgi:hypothetical protein
MTEVSAVTAKTVQDMEQQLQKLLKESKGQ